MNQPPRSPGSDERNDSGEDVFGRSLSPEERQKVKQTDALVKQVTTDLKNERDENRRLKGENEQLKQALLALKARLPDKSRFPDPPRLGKGIEVDYEEGFKAA